MKLNCKKNIDTLIKVLYVKQLNCYAKLCVIYKELSYFCGHNSTADEVQKKYSHILSIASSGNLDHYITSEFSEKEQELLYEYEKYSQLFNKYKEDIKIISEVKIDE